MNILLIGGCNSFLNNLIIKLKKEGHRVYLLTGSRSDTQPYQRVFERYNFPYDSSCLNEIFESIHPDVTIYMGAYDSNYSWKNEESEAVRYISCMMNILMSYISYGIGRFICLSSQDVYDGDFNDDIEEDVPQNPRGYKGMALVQAETMCLSYRVNYERDVVVLRLDHIFSIPERYVDVKDPCTKMCLEGLDKNIITVDENNTISLLYVTDAIEYLYRVVTCGNHKFDLYNISTGRPVTEGQLADLVRKYLGFQVEIVPAGTRKKRKILCGKRFEEEFGKAYLCENDAIIRKIVDHMKKHRNVFLYGEEKKKSFREIALEHAGWFVKVIIPFLENIICFLIFFALNNMHIKYFTGLDFYLLYVLLFAIVYGQQQVICSATLSVLGYCYSQMMERSGFDLMLDSSTYIWIAQLFILGLAVGYMRDYITKLNREQSSEKDFLHLQLHDIKDINEVNVRVKDALETQIINQNDSVGKIYSITSSLDKYSQEEVLFYAAEMIASLVKSNDVAIYTVSNDNYARLFSRTSEEAKKMGNSIRYTELGELYETIAERKVFINRKLDEQYPLMSNAIFDEDGKMQLIIMIWNIPWERMTLGQANQLVVIGALIHDAVVRANKYIAVLEQQRYVGDSRMLDEEAFTALVNAYTAAGEKGLTDCVILRVTNIPKDNFGVASNHIADFLRTHDYVGTVKDDLLVLLSNTNRTDAAFVINRLAQSGFESEIL